MEGGRDRERFLSTSLEWVVSSVVRWGGFCAWVSDSYLGGFCA